MQDWGETGLWNAMIIFFLGRADAGHAASAWLKYQERQDHDAIELTYDRQKKIIKGRFFLKRARSY